MPTTPTTTTSAPASTRSDLRDAADRDRAKTTFHVAAAFARYVWNHADHADLVRVAAWDTMQCLLDGPIPMWAGPVGETEPVDVETWPETTTSP